LLSPALNPRFVIWNIYTSKDQPVNTPIKSIKIYWP
jgi:hypothetical protein